MTTINIIELAQQHGATSYRNRADTQNPAYGFTEDGLQRFAQALLAAAPIAPDAWKRDLSPPLPLSPKLNPENTITQAIDALVGAAFVEGGVSPGNTLAAHVLTEQRKRELIAAIGAQCLHQIAEPGKYPPLPEARFAIDAQSKDGDWVSVDVFDDNQMLAYYDLGRQQVDKQPNLQDALVDKSANLQARTAAPNTPLYDPCEVAFSTVNQPLTVAPAAVAGPTRTVIADAEIKAAYVKAHGTDAGWLGIAGSYFVSGWSTRQVPQVAEEGGAA